MNKNINGDRYKIESKRNSPISREISLYGKIKLEELDGVDSIADEQLFELGKRISRIGIRELFIDINNVKSISDEKIAYWIYSLKSIGIKTLYIIGCFNENLNFDSWKVSGGINYIYEANHPVIENIKEFIHKIKSNYPESLIRFGIQVKLNQILNDLDKFFELVQLLKDFPVYYLLIEITGKVSDKEKINVLPQIVDVSCSYVNNVFLSFGNLNSINQKCINNMIECKTDKYIIDFTDAAKISKEEFSNYAKIKPVVKSFLNVKKILSKKTV